MNLSNCCSCFLLIVEELLQCHGFPRTCPLAAIADPCIRSVRRNFYGKNTFVTNIPPQKNLNENARISYNTFREKILHKENLLIAYFSYNESITLNFISTSNECIQHYNSKFLNHIPWNNNFHGISWEAVSTGPRTLIFRDQFGDLRGYIFPAVIPEFFRQYR